MLLDTVVISLVQEVQGQLPPERKAGIPFGDIPPGRTISRVIIVRKRSHVSEHIWSPTGARFISIHGGVRPSPMASPEMKELSVFQVVRRCIGQKIERIHLE